MLNALPQPQRALFWAKPVDPASDFVVEDPLAFDDLGQRVGSWLFGGLTPRTTRAQYFAVVLYGLWLVDTELGKRGLTADDAQRKAMYERWERLWALAVHEHKVGDFELGDLDTVRGQRGALRAWRPGDDDLPLDYKLISRQSELGGLGAYTTALRNDHTALLVAGTLQPTSVAMPIIDAFWDEPGSATKLGAYESFARLALEPERKRIPRKAGEITLRRLGEMSRLTVLTARQRAAQQDRLWRVLFENTHDDTLRFAELVQAAARAAIHEPRGILTEALAGRFGSLEDHQREKLEIALAFGDVQATLTTAFNRVFAAALAADWRVDLAIAAQAIREPLREACARLLDAAWTPKLRALPNHGEQLVQLVTVIARAAPADAVVELVRYHGRIHRERRNATPWLRQQAGKVVVVVGGCGHRAEAEGTFPALKLGVVRRLLTDLGRLA